MAIYHNGYKDIKVTLLDFEPNIAEKVYNFGKYGGGLLREYGTYDENSDDVKEFFEALFDGTTFPKYCFDCLRLSFSIEGLSRIGLSQLTRDNGVFCSGSHGGRPLKQEYVIPTNIYNDDEIMEYVKQAQKLLDKAYIKCCEKNYSYTEMRYLVPGNHVINVSASYNVSSFVRNCYNRTNNNFEGELCYVFRKMYNEVMKNVEKTEGYSKLIWKWLLKKCINDDVYTRMALYNNDFCPSTYGTINPKYPTICDWRKTAWKMELERIYKEEPELLTEKEKKEIEYWLSLEKQNIELPTTNKDDYEFSPKNNIKNYGEYYEN